MDKEGGLLLLSFADDKCDLNVRLSRQRLLALLSNVSSEVKLAGKLVAPSAFSCFLSQRQKRVSVEEWACLQLRLRIG